MPIPPALLLVGLMLTWANSASAQEPDLLPREPGSELPAPLEEVPAETATLDRADLEAWLDGVMTYALPRNDIAGAVVVVVADGEVLLQKGYGYADVEAGRPVDPERTLFRPGSVSKLVTWTAVMQLVERDLVDLDADINRYLDFEIPAEHGRPVTMRHILTHTPGFEEQIKGLMGKGQQEPSLAGHLKRWVPTQIFPPGEMPAYSNYATALAGYVVERVSGMSFDDYLDRHIFEPLGMHYSTFRQPLPERLAEHMSKGYRLGSQPPEPFEIVGPAPAGSMSASGADMARFMIAHLQKGAFGDTRILAQETAEAMHGTANTVIPGLNRMMLGFYETAYNGHRVIAHGGDTVLFHTYLHLFLDENVGFYVSVNSSGTPGATNGLRQALFQDFADRYFPADVGGGFVDEQTAREHARLLAGRYDSSRRAQTNFFSILNLFGQIKVTANEDGTVSVPVMTTLAGEPRKYREESPWHWREVGGTNRLAAEVVDGRVRRFSIDEVSPFMMMLPTPALRNGAWLIPALFAAVGVLLLSTLAWPTAALVRRHYGATYGLAGSDARAHLLVRAAGAAALLLCIAWAATVSSMMSDYSLLSPSTDPWIWILQLLSLVIFVGGTFVALWNARVVFASGRRPAAKAWAVILVLAFLAILWVALTHDLIAFDVNY